MENTRNPAENRIERWTQKLLDFSARNRLLNIPASSRQVLPLVCADLGELENHIADNRLMTLRSLADAVGEEEYAEFAAGRAPAEKYRKTVESEFAHQRLCIAMPPKDVRRRLTDLYHDAKTELEESGVNTLYLTLGVLRWMEPGTGAGRKTYRAPILMVPVRLERASMAEGVKVHRLDEDASLNPTLVEFLRSQFGVKPQGIDPLPTDDSGVEVSAVLKAFADAVSGLDGWSVAEEAFLGCFSFGKFVMWKDLTDRAEELRKSPLVEHLVGGGGRFDDGIATFPPEEISARFDPSQVFCPVSYDSSQLTAVLYSALGKSFVLHGPPGTGKSQTITNLIAHNLALGRRVLFVSEKKAALDVVKERLDRIGLTPFCLELHSNKTEKRYFFQQLREALEAPETQPPRDWQRTVTEFEQDRRALDGYVAALHRVYPNGLTAYHCFQRTIQHGAVGCPELLAVDCLQQSRDEYRDARAAVGELETDFRGVTPAALKAIPGVKSVSWSPLLERELAGTARTLADAAEGLAIAPAAFAAAYADAVRRDALEGELKGYALDRLGDYSLDGIAETLEANARAFALVRAIKNFILFRTLKGLFSPGAPRPDAAKLAADLPKLREYAAVLARTSAAPAAEVYARRAALAAPYAAFDAAFDVMTLPKEGELTACCRGIAENIGELRGAMRYRTTLLRAQALGAGAFSDYLADGGSAAVDAFDDAYAARMLDAVLKSAPELAEFSGEGQEERIERFRRLDRKCQELSRKVVFARLAAKCAEVRGGPSTKGSELGLIKRECEKKMRHRAVRQILAECSSLVPALKPCFLMSPLSVAQYLPVGSEPFDLVVFDEASQIPVWDAIGVIARGRQLVVVGDPKQMPPTNFFQKGDSDEEEFDEDAIEDQESILDECLVAGVPSTYLNWHYRSRHEALIAFSNEHYYESRLCTFPAAVDSPRLGVGFRFVEGGRFVRQGKGAKGNEIEAKALVDYVVETVRKPGYKPRSVGIVTFSMTQQKLIRTLLEERRAADPVLERLLPEEGEGAYFVKNLENVQGDESDVILFSVGYAPDENGRFTMNFGPLNLAGGERRLNVAVTRAREQVIVFSSIHGSQIDAGEGGRTKAVGAADLKAFLDYAEKGAGTKTAASAASSGGFGDLVADFLRAKGYEVDRDVGCSAYRIDLAVRDPRKPGAYLLGIECDGPAYADQRTAQDREVNRSGVLAGLGWKLCRVWSVDWAFDRRRAEERLLAQLR